MCPDRVKDALCLTFATVRPDCAASTCKKTSSLRCLGADREAVLTTLSRKATAMTSSPGTLHATALAKDVAYAHASLKESLERTLLELLRLQKVIVRPGWTTPAEFLLVK